MCEIFQPFQEDLDSFFKLIVVSSYSDDKKFIDVVYEMNNFYLLYQLSKNACIRNNINFYNTSDNNSHNIEDV